MIKILMGEKGTGKTKAFIEMVNRSINEEKGNVICIMKGDRHLFDLKSAIDQFMEQETIMVTKKTKKSDFNF